MFDMYVAWQDNICLGVYTGNLESIMNMLAPQGLQPNGFYWPPLGFTMGNGITRVIMLGATDEYLKVEAECLREIAESQEKLEKVNKVMKETQFDMFPCDIIVDKLDMFIDSNGSRIVKGSGHPEVVKTLKASRSRYSIVLRERHRI